jgi:hypothetical protein
MGKKSLAKPIRDISVSSCKERVRLLLEKNYMIKKKQKGAAIPLVKDTNETSFADDLNP